MPRRAWFPIWCIPLVIALAIGTVWLRLYIVRTTYSIDHAEREMRSLKEQREQMELKVTALRSPRKLEVIARSRFGLSHPRADQVIHMSAAAPSRDGPLGSKP